MAHVTVFGKVSRGNCTMSLPWARPLRHVVNEPNVARHLDGHDVHLALSGEPFVKDAIGTSRLSHPNCEREQRKILPSFEHRQSRYLNNRAEVSHHPTRRRARQIKRFKVSTSCAALSLHPQPDPQPFPAPPSSPRCQPASCGSMPPFRTWRDVAEVAHAA
jgi:putative transposase